jgi:hypothetical protein
LEVRFYCIAGQRLASKFGSIVEGSEVVDVRVAVHCEAGRPQFPEGLAGFSPNQMDVQAQVPFKQGFGVWQAFAEAEGCKDLKCWYMERQLALVGVDPFISRSEGQAMIRSAIVQALHQVFISMGMLYVDRMGEAEFLFDVIARVESEEDGSKWNRYSESKNACNHSAGSGAGFLAIGSEGSAWFEGRCQGS